MIDDYTSFLAGKRQLAGDFGFEPTFIPEECFPFQRDLITWAVRKGRGALFADCGLGKTLIQLAFAENVARHTGGRVLVLTPLAVSHQTESEGLKFGILAKRSSAGELPAQIVITNYERLHYFRPEDFVGVVCDESSILKNFKGATKSAVTEFMRTLRYRLLCTATAAPNDFIELGTSSEALGHLGYIAMLQRFFKSVNGSYAQGGSGRGGRFAGGESFSSNFRLKPHAHRDFWRWVCSWARAIRSPADFGYDAGCFQLPPLVTREFIVKARTKNPEFLFDMPAHGLAEQRAERARTLHERCEKAAELVSAHGASALCWCNLNSEGDLLAKLIPNSVQVSGDDSDEVKEERFRAFENGQVRVLVTKPTIGGFGLNWQHCAHQTFFPSHSFEQWYQAIRRSWRFGQTQPVTVDVIASEGEQRVLANLERKAADADKMFSQLVAFMSDELLLRETNKHTKTEELPLWLS